MLATLYRGVIRLHPPAFRERFGDEMVSIFERAQGARTALLLLDALVSLIRQWGLRSEFCHSLDPPPARPALDGVPTFSSIDPFRPRSAAVIEGLVLSITLFCLTCFAIRYSWIRVLHVRIPEVQFERPTWRPESRSTSTSESVEKPDRPVRQNEAPVALFDALPAANNSAVASLPRPMPAKGGSRKRARPASLDTASANSDATPNSPGGELASTDGTPLPLQTFEGTYVVDSPRKLTIVVTGEKESLAMKLMDQPRLGLIPLSRTRFAVSGTTDCWIDFIPDRDSSANQPARQIKLSCNGEQLIARRQ